MAKHNELTDENVRYQIFQGHVDCTLAANAQNLSCSLKVNEFAALSISELVSRYTGRQAKQCVPNNVWCAPKHLRTHEYVGEPL